MTPALLEMRDAEVTQVDAREALARAHNLAGLSTTLVALAEAAIADLEAAGCVKRAAIHRARIRAAMAKQEKRT